MLPSDAEPAAAPESLLRSLFEQAPGFIAVLEGPQHRFTLVNRAYDRLIGDRDLIGRPAAEAVPESVAQGFIDILDKVLSTGEPFIGRRMPLMVRRVADEALERHYLDFVYQPVFDGEGRAAGIFVEGHDVTDHVEAELALQREAAQREAQSRVFDTVLSAIEDFAYTFDREGRFTYANKPLLDLLGIGLDELVGKTSAELPHPAAPAARLDQDLLRVVQSRAQVRGEISFVGPSGRTGWFEYILNPVFGHDGEVMTIAGSTRDVTTRHEQERRLAALGESERAARVEGERAGRLKDEFLATLSHELRTPLNAILGWSELLRSGRFDGAKVVEAAERISRNARSQAQLIADLLDMNGILSGKIRLEIERVSLAGPVRAAMDAVKIDALRKKVVLQAPRQRPDFTVDCDPGRIQQVLWNLLANAVKFTPAGGSIAVEIRRDGDDAEIVVRDSGIGIEPAFLPHLFERFSQADSSSTRTHGGLGLGLSIGKSLVELHGGTIAAASEGVGEGTTVVVRMPLRHEHASERPNSVWGDLEPPMLPRRDHFPSLSGARILVVDDDDEGRNLMVAVLRDYGALTSAASSAEEALAALAAEAPSMLLCDIGMPDVDGYELLRRVRRVSAVPAIAVTAFARPEDRRMALQSGFAEHIAKPAEPGALLQACVAVLERARSLDAGPAVPS